MLYRVLQWRAGVSSVVILMTGYVIWGHLAGPGLLSSVVVYEDLVEVWVDVWDGFID
jgi:hypothetical protein